MKIIHQTAIILTRMSIEQRIVFEGIAAVEARVNPGEILRTNIRVPVNETADTYICFEVSCEKDNSGGLVKYKNPVYGEDETEKVTRRRIFSMDVRSDDGKMTGTIKWRRTADGSSRVEMLASTQS